MTNTDQEQGASDLGLIARARGCAEAILRDYARVRVRKAIRLDSPEEFDRAVGRLAAALRVHAQKPEREAVRAALAVLDVAWPTTTATQRRELLRRAMAIASEKLARVPAQVGETLSEGASRVVAASREGIRREGLSIGVGFSALDNRVKRFMTRSHVLFVRDEYGKRLESFGKMAREAVARGMAAGLGRDDTAELLAQAAEQAMLRRHGRYWEILAGSFVGRGRSYAQVSAYAEAGITRYRIEAVLDERTSNVCRFLHGRTFTVGDALRSFEEAERLKNPEEIKDLNPWVRVNGSALYLMRGGTRIVVGEVVRSGEGKWDNTGEFATQRSSAALSALGLGFPPYHGLCRTTTTAVTR